MDDKLNVKKKDPNALIVGVKALSAGIVVYFTAFRGSGVLLRCINFAIVK